MPVEFALRPRIRLREDPAPARRARPRLPKFAVPALAYWLAIGGLVYAFVRQHDASAPPPEAEAALAPAMAPAPAPTVRQWWRPLPARAEPAPAPDLPLSEPPTASESEALQALLPEHGEPPAVAPVATESPPTEGLPAEPAPRERPLAEVMPDRGALAARSLPASRPVFRPAPPRSSTPPREPATADNDVGVPALALAPLFPPSSDLAPAPAPAPAPGSASGLPSCEAALATASQDVDFSGGNRTADLPTRAIAAVLENGAWLSSCAVPEQTTLDICVAIKGGRVVGASVASRPANAALNSCVKRRASSLQFPYSPHLDLARTRF